MTYFNLFFSFHSPYLFTAVQHELQVVGELGHLEPGAGAARLVLVAGRGGAQRVVPAQHLLLAPRQVYHWDAGQLVAGILYRVIFINILIKFITQIKV